MITISEIIRILNKHADIVYEEDGGHHDLMIRENEFYKIAKEIVKQSKDNNKPNIIKV